MNKKIAIGIAVVVLVVLIIVLLCVFRPWQGKQQIDLQEVEPTEQSGETEQLPEEPYGTVNQSGDFNLEVPQVKVLSKMVDTYNKVSNGMSYESIVQMLGAPKERDSYKILTYYDWFLDSNGYIRLKVSIKNETGKVTEKSLLLFSNEELGYKLSSELETEIADLPSELEKVNVGMTLEDVIEILGDKYIEESRNENDYKAYVWFDVNENSAELSFDDKDILTQKNIASYKG